METSKYLPLEIVLNIITCSLPNPKAILPPSHDTTKQLLTFTLVCHETRRLANRYLRERCMYLSSPDRLTSFNCTITQQPTFRSITSLSLSPFHDTIDDPSTCLHILELFTHTAPTLRRLIIDMPLRSCYPEDDHRSVRPILRSAFSQLVNLEEFVSTRDELYLAITDAERHPAVWRSWKKLKRLSLYNVDLTSEFWRDVAALPLVETLVLPRVDGNDESLEEWAEYFKTAERGVNVLMLGTERRRMMPDALLAGRVKNRAGVVDGVVMIRSIWLRDTVGFEIEDCQEFVREHAEMGTLWDLNKGTVPCNGPPYEEEPYLGQLGKHWLLIDERRNA